MAVGRTGLAAMSSVIVLIGTPDPDEEPSSSSECFQSYLQERQDYFECRKAHWALGLTEVFDFIAVLLRKPEEGASGA